MNSHPHRSATRALRIAGICVSCVIPLLAGCQTREGLEAAGISWATSDRWEVVDREAFRVPGTPLSAWRGPEGSSLVIYRALRAPGATAASLAIKEATRFEAFPGATAITHDVIDLAGGIKAARIEAVAPGRGVALAAPAAGLPLPVAGDPESDSDLVLTRRVSLAVPRERETIWVAFHLPEEAHARLSPEIDQIIRSLQIRGAGQENS